MAQEFHISVTPLGEDEYLVRIERVAPGVPLAEEQVRWPVEDWLAQARQLMNDPLLGVLQGNPAFVENMFYLPQREELTESSLNLVALGQQLYNALFQGSLRDSWMMAQAIAQNHGQILRLRLGLKGTRLPRLPWEVLHGGDHPLATGTEVAFSRYQLGARLRRPLHAPPAQRDQPLKILMVISSPSDQETLELAQEAKKLEAELNRRLPNSPPTIDLDLDILEQPGRGDLTQALEQGQYQVFHYAGHSNLGESGGDVYLVSNKTGLTETLNGDDLAGLLVNNGVQLAVFNSCRGAYTATSDRLEPGKDRNLADALVKRGIPAVLAMAERIPDQVAQDLTALLYRNLNQGYPIDLSLSRARQGLISSYGSNELYWALPVLYLHPEFDGFLINSERVTHNRDELLQVRPDPHEPSLTANKGQGLFSPPPRVTPASFHADENELAKSSMLDWIGYEDESIDDFPDDLEADESDADDPSTFIKSLLDQLGTESVAGESALPPLGSENRQRAASEAINSDLPATSSKTQPPRPKQSAVTNLSAGTSQASRPQVQNPAKSPQAVGSQKSGVLKSWWQKLRFVPRLWMLIGATGVLAIALLGFWFFHNREPKLNELPSPSISQNDNLQKADTATVTNIAIKQFAQGNILEGQKAVEKLLDNGALPQAKAALDAVSKSKLDDPTVNFLKGRLAWQSIQAGSKDYSLDDARRFWETAQKSQPNSPTYLNALGFAYYAEGNYDRANQAWWDALSQVKETKVADAAKNFKKRESLNIYAGLALGLRQSAQKQPAAKQASLLSKSLQLRQFVMENDPVNFQPDALSKNWLWSEKAIQDWRSLLAITKPKQKA